MLTPSTQETMNENNTLLGRCTVALDEAISTINYPPHTMRARRAGVAAVLDHLAAEIAVMVERAPNLTAHQLITILRLEAAGELGGYERD
jgi:hypothetical protein